LEDAVEETAFAADEALLAPTPDLIAFEGALSADEDGV
jgi:hypothetical protein